MQKKGVVGLVLIFILFLLIKLKSTTDNSLMLESKRNIKKTVECENFEVSVNMMHHPCGQTIKENMGSSNNVNASNSENSIDRIKSFETIYEKDIWKNNGESKSGGGSTKDSTKQIQRILNNVVDYLKLELQKDRIR